MGLFGATASPFPGGEPEPSPPQATSPPPLLLLLEPSQAGASRLDAVLLSARPEGLHTLPSRHHQSPACSFLRRCPPAAHPARCTSQLCGPPCWPLLCCRTHGARSGSSPIGQTSPLGRGLLGLRWFARWKTFLSHPVLTPGQELLRLSPDPGGPGALGAGGAPCGPLCRGG